MEPNDNSTTNMAVSMFNIKQLNKKRLLCILLCLVVITLLLFTQGQIYQFKIYNFNFFGAVSQERKELYTPTCANVLDRGVVGQWVRGNVTQQEVDEVDNFYTVFRQIQGIKQTLQRADGRCGNLQLDGAGKHGEKDVSFRALCDPNGTVPCCFEYKCVSKPVEQCRCEHCYDVRQQIYTELSTWVPADPNCKILEFKGEQETCKLLKDVTIYFVGDSFMRQLYISMITLVRENHPHGVLTEKVTAEQEKLCHRNLIMSSTCKSAIILDTTDCDNRTRLRLITHWRADQTSMTVQYMKELQGRPNTFLIFGAGVHQGFDLNVVENQIMKPIMQQLSKSPWPVPVWMSTHAVGLLKPPMYTSQQTENVVKYNPIANGIMRRNGIAVMDFYQMTDKVMSYDGTHYGITVNDLKAQILLNHILEVRLNTTNEIRLMRLNTTNV